MQVLIMITSGQKVNEVANQLCLSPKTVNSYRYRLFDKLGIDQIRGADDNVLYF